MARKMIRLQINLEGKIKDYDGKEVNVVPIGVPTRVYSPEQGEKRIPMPKSEFMQRLLEQTPKRADAYTLSESREAEDLFPSLDLRYGTIRLYAHAQFYHITDTPRKK